LLRVEYSAEEVAETAAPNVGLDADMSAEGTARDLVAAGSCRFQAKMAGVASIPDTKKS